MISATIIGGAGYTGSELTRLLLAHPEVTVQRVVSKSQAGQPVPGSDGKLQFEETVGSVSAMQGVDIVFFATPNGTAMTQAPQLLEAGIKVVDLAADFRLANPQQWQQYYEMSHSCPELLDAAVYGLPECWREQIKTANLVANPGCYPTSVILGFKPLLESGLADASCLIADSKSGTSGAGRSSDVHLSFSECGENFKAYKPTVHRHFPEIKNQLDRVAGAKTTLAFTPHLLPVVRGIHSSLYFKTDASAAQLQSAFESAYKDEPFVHVLAAGSCPELKQVRETNHCLIAVHRQEDSPFGRVLVVIDNLVKGAAGQAVQNMNLMFGLAETAGLSAPHRA